jgi:hypothetical protein
MSFPLAVLFLYSIIPPADVVPIKTWIIWDFDQELSGVRMFAHAEEIYGR